jgi:hypothetical protein
MRGQIGGKGHFARMILRDDGIQEAPQVLFNETENRDYHQHIAYGIYYALSNHGLSDDAHHYRITVLNIIHLPVDTTPNTMMYTAALATWRLLTVHPKNEPYFERDQFHFPGIFPSITDVSDE